MKLTHVGTRFPTNNEQAIREYSCRFVDGRSAGKER